MTPTQSIPTDRLWTGGFSIFSGWKNFIFLLLCLSLFVPINILCCFISKIRCWHTHSKRSHRQTDRLEPGAFPYLEVEKKEKIVISWLLRLSLVVVVNILHCCFISKIRCWHTRLKRSHRQMDILEPVPFPFLVVKKFIKKCHFLASLSVFICSHKHSSLFHFKN